MPVKLASRQAAESEARIEIIPLIDIMFFLLAAFMLVSNIAVDKAGVAYVEGKPIGNNDLVANLTALQKTNSSPRIFVSGDREARHGDVIRVLDLVRSAGIERIAFEIREPDGGEQ